MVSRAMRRRLRISVRLMLSWRPSGQALIDLVRAVATSFVALGITLYVVPGRQSSGPLSVFVLVVTVLGIGVLLRPVLLGLTTLLGPFGLLIVGVLAQGSILAVALSIDPRVHVSTLPRIFAISWIAASIAAVVNWLLDAGTQDAFLAHLLGRVVRIAHAYEPETPAGQAGLLVVQLDGVGRGLLRQAVVAGAVPTLSRWLREGSHRGYGWHTGLPATTPAGQAVLLHGATSAIPSFRWYEKDAQRLVVANHAADAKLIEQRLSTGRGLLADGGVSVSNLFSGDAPTRILTMSDAQLPDRHAHGLAAFATTSVGFVRTVVVFVGKVVLELYQARRQRRRDVRPRVRRGGVFALLRGVTAGLLHDLNVTIVAEQMARGAPVIFVDFVDYDEIAHHAGPSRPEAIRALDDLDRVLRFFEDVAAETNRRYEIVVVSDHGQAQGEPFAGLTGRTLDEVVAELTEQPALATATRRDDSEEPWGPVNLLLTSAARSRRRGVGALARRRSDQPGPREELVVSHRRRTGDGAARPGDAPVVAASGSLAHIYLPDLAGRATLEQVDERYPRLVPGLRRHLGIGLVVARSATGLRVLGRDGWREFDDAGAVRAGEGADPVAGYGPCAVGHQEGRHHPPPKRDKVVDRRVEPATHHV
ncbi:MAG: alkaline phosphatase family protein, partial [Jatrophihabitans sp.]|uniref:alkaline phosphatase family protein n=1 Tax=Jatrophihabitans sp. TaxID=1932789 RepID=UPI003F80EAFC